MSSEGSRTLGLGSSEKRQDENVRVSVDRATFEPFQPHKGGRWHPELKLHSVLMKKKDIYIYYIENRKNGILALPFGLNQDISYIHIKILRWSLCHFVVLVFTLSSGLLLHCAACWTAQSPSSQIRSTNKMAKSKKTLHSHIVFAFIFRHIPGIFP